MTGESALAAFFDLNVEQVLEHWGIAEAVRELLANALDEHLLGHGGPPEAFKDSNGSWHVRDYGRGLQPHHFTQNENPEKLRSDLVVGRFGVGLKDALAVLHRHGVEMQAFTPDATITTAMHPKSGFAIDTLHAVFAAPRAGHSIGTDVVLDGVSDDDMHEAQRFFRHWTPVEELELTPYGSVLRKEPDHPGAVYVRGVRVAEEPEFLFSYDITKLTSKLTRALNRERSNVSRTAYGDRVKDILLATASPVVVDELTRDLAAFATGEQHAESTWIDVSIHAARIVNAGDDAVFVTAGQLSRGGPLFDYARSDGKRLIVVPDKLAKKLAVTTDARGELIRTLARYAEEWNNSFEFHFVEPAELTVAEREVFERAPRLFELAGFAPSKPWTLHISETMRPGRDEELGVCIHRNRQIVVRRDQLRDARAFAGTLLHEVVHAVTGADDATLAFEHGLTEMIGSLAELALEPGEA